MKSAQLDATCPSQNAHARSPYARKIVWSRPNFLYRPRNAFLRRSQRWLKVSAPSTTLSLRLSFSHINGMTKPLLAPGLLTLIRTYAIVWNNRNTHLAALRTLFWFYTHAPQFNAHHVAMACLKKLTRPRTYTHTLLLGSLKRKLF